MSFSSAVVQYPVDWKYLAKLFQRGVDQSQRRQDLWIRGIENGCLCYVAEVPLWKENKHEKVRMKIRWKGEMLNEFIVVATKTLGVHRSPIRVDDWRAKKKANHRDKDSFKCLRSTCETLRQTVRHLSFGLIPLYSHIYTKYTARQTTTQHKNNMKSFNLCAARCHSTW